jgi:two-component system sensor histidine kinase KdpD
MKRLKNLRSRKIFVSQSGWMQYLLSAIIVVIINFICYSFYKGIGYQVVSLLFLFTVSMLPLFGFGPGPTLLAALLSALSWDYFFIPPQYTFHIAKIEDFLMFVMYFIVAFVTGVLSARIRQKGMIARQREERTNALYNLLKELSAAPGINEVAEITIRNIEQVFDVEAILFFLNKEGNLSTKQHVASTFSIDEVEWNIAQWVFLNSIKAGKFTDTLPYSSSTYYPIASSRNKLGVIGIRTFNEEQLSADQLTLLDAFITQITTIVEREYLNDFAKQSLLIAESEKLYKTLFNSISHELKTPITTIIGAASSLSSDSFSNNPELGKNLSMEINIAAERLNRLVENLLDMARLESGTLKLKLDWNDISDLVYDSVHRLKTELVNHKVNIAVAKDIKLFKFDFGLMEQALINIIHNSVIYTPDGSQIKIDVRKNIDECIIKIADNGPGFPAESLPKLFQKFYRIPGSKTGGTGLGLSIAKGFIDAHKGSITAGNRSKGGACFTIKIPLLT